MDVRQAGFTASAYPCAVKKNLWMAALVLALLVPRIAAAAGPLGPAALQARHGSLAAELASNAFGGPLVLKSEEASRRIDGEVFAVLEHPFAKVSGALSDPLQW